MVKFEIDRMLLKQSKPVINLESEINVYSAI